MNANPVCAIVVTYHPDGGFPNVARIAPQVGALVIVDNGWTRQARMPRELPRDPAGTASETRTAIGNPGIEWGEPRRGARAEHRHRARRGPWIPWVLLLDQDSSSTPGCSRLYSRYTPATRSENDWR